ncbi:hypothetical protein ACWEOA_21910 [Streptomyces sp. NPDC004457]|uniref:hypothetical protein n=1 Tax=Streptomyces spinosus TaxID=2872623 RepID=UPI001CEDB12E|nr:hypothetical protein [Streptomyces spinosus]
MPGPLSGLATTSAAGSGTVPPDAPVSVHLVNRRPRGVRQEDAREGMTVLLGGPLSVTLAG